jgi:hypothetical protein
MEYTKSLFSGHLAWSDPDQILMLAQNLYDRLFAENNWNGIDQNKTTFPGFKSPQAATAFFGKVNCHNCGGPHYLRGCIEPFTQDRISENKKLVQAVRKVAGKEGKARPKEVKSSSGHAPGGNFPPKPEKGHSNRCTVDGIHYYYHFKSNK